MYVCEYTAKSLQSCPTLCDPIDGNPPGSPIPGILQARTLDWVAISFSNAWNWKVKVKSLSHVQLLESPWTAAYQALPSMGFSRQEYWSGMPLPSPIYIYMYICVCVCVCVCVCIYIYTQTYIYIYIWCMKLNNEIIRVNLVLYKHMVPTLGLFHKWKLL